MKRRSITAVCAAAAPALGYALAGCNTIRGFGEENHGLGRTTSRATQTTENAIQPSGDRKQEELLRHPW